VAVGQNTNTATTMKLSSVEATVTVRGETALLDTRKVSTGANVTQVELKSIPTARDPWVILQTVPGVQTDRLNVGGNESGQQTNYVGKGAQGAQNVWNLDGVTITDVAALGSSPTYYDFDSFEEISATTGGSDVTATTPGVQLNLVTKRGTNEVHGSARMYLAQEEWQSRNLPGEAEDQGFAGGNRIDEVQDYGVEVGGPIVRDRVWLWGAYGRNQIDLLTITGASDKTTLEDTNGKLNVQFLESTAGTVTYSKGDKIKLGRNVGVTRAPETGWNQTGPTTLYKGELSQVFSSKVFATASYSYVSGGFQLTPAAGRAVEDVFKDAGGTWQNSYAHYETVRPQHQAGANGSFFFNTGNAGHELKFGFSYRDTPVNSLTVWPGNGNWGCLECFGSGLRDTALLSRPAVTKGDLEYLSGYVGDTITIGSLTVNAGARYDLQRGENKASVVPENPVAPDILPGVQGEAVGREFEWEDVSPRLGLTYAVGDQKKLVLRSSYARYADQLGIAQIFHTNPAQLAGIYYYWNDDGDLIVQREELDFAAGQQGFYGFDPSDPGAAVSNNLIDPSFEAGITDEFIVGFDYELMPEFVVGVNYTYRNYDGQPLTGSAARPIGLTPDDYTLCTTETFPDPDGPGEELSPCDAFPTGFVTGTLADGTTYSEPIYRLRPGIDAPGGVIQENRSDWKSIYHGIDLTFQKRLSNKWMVRGNFGWQDWKQESGLGACWDPTNSINIAQAVLSCPGDDIDMLVVGAASGAKASVFINSRWQFNVGGLYELPLGFNVAANLYGREGYPFLNYHAANPGDGLGGRNVIVKSFENLRHDDVFNLDARVEKVINLQRLQVALSLDVFNVLNDGTVIQRQGQTNAPSYNRIQEIQSPRVVRAGARVTF
jgi:hypothetical protein